METLIKGMDISSLLEVEACGGRFYDGDEPGDAMEILRRYGMNLVRLRLWNDPYTEGGEPYGGGTNDLARTMTLARRAQSLGVDWMLDFHYSDFWVDPGKQWPPKAWRGLDEAGLERAVYEYTASVMRTLRRENLLPALVAVGNELSCGLLWPSGKYPNFDNIARYLNAAIRAVRELDAGIPIVLHLDNGGKSELYREWFDSYFAAGGADFEIIGLSFYPFWHGKMEGLRQNMNDLALRYHKDMIVVEAAAGFSLEDYQEYEKLADSERRGMSATPALAKCIDYPMTPAGQCRYLEELAAVLRQVPEGRGKGFVYWEPAWIPVPGSQWSNACALPYIQEKGPGGNEQANQCLFDYDGRALPALETIRML